MTLGEFLDVLRGKALEVNYWPLVILDEEGNELPILAAAVDDDGEQVLIKVRGGK